MLLVIDIGNSRTKLGLFENRQLVKTFFFPNGEFNFERFENYKIDNAAISSVVPSETEKIISELSSRISSEPFLITHKSKFNLILDYKTPETLGLDRLCSAEGAYGFIENKYDESTIILTIDFGTASTINVVEYPKKFTGGIIMPGIHLMNKSLHQNTKQLPLVDFNNYNDIIGKSTEEAITSGIINSTLGTIGRVFKKYSDKKIYSFITGGNAEIILPHLDFEYRYEKDLVLCGIERIYKANL